MTWKMPFHPTRFFPLSGCCILDKKWGRNPSFNPIGSTGQWTLCNSCCMELNNSCLIKTERLLSSENSFRKLKVLTLPAYSCCVFPCPPLPCASHSQTFPLCRPRFVFHGSFMGFSILFKFIVSKSFENKQWFIYFHNTFRGKEAQWSRAKFQSPALEKQVCHNSSA